MRTRTCLVGSCCCCTFLFAFVLSISALIAENYYFSTWFPQVDLSDIQVISVNVSGDYPNLFLDADFNFTLNAREFSKHPSYERISFTITPSFRNNVLANCKIPAFRPRGNYDDTQVLTCELVVNGFTLSRDDAAALQNQLENQIFLLKVQVGIFIVPRNYWFHGDESVQMCNLILTPPSASNATTSTLRQFCA